MEAKYKCILVKRHGIVSGMVFIMDKKLFLLGFS